MSYNLSNQNFKLCLWKLNQIRMIKKTLLLCSLASAIGVSAQEVVSTQGDTYSNSNATLSFTIGETVINTATDGITTLTQGFHQSKWTFVGLKDYSPNYEVIIFPNPTEDVLNIKTEQHENVSYTLYDLQGKLVLQNQLTAVQTPIQVSHLAPGSYSLILNDKTKVLKTFKLIKSR